MHHHDLIIYRDCTAFHDMPVLPAAYAVQRYPKGKKARKREARRRYVALALLASLGFWLLGTLTSCAPAAHSFAQPEPAQPTAAR